MLQAVTLLATLKPKRQVSHTAVLTELLVEKLKAQEVKTEIIRLADYNIKPGVEPNMGRGDDWPKIAKKLLAADILVFATPTWWGGHSSLMQQAMERMDQIRSSEFRKSGKSPLNNKVGGIVVTGGEDGAENIISRLAMFASWIGLSLPPACSLSVISADNFEDQPKTKIMKQYRQDYDKQATINAKNLAALAKLLKANKIYPD